MTKIWLVFLVFLSAWKRSPNWFLYFQFFCLSLKLIWFQNYFLFLISNNWKDGLFEIAICNFRNCATLTKNFSFDTYRPLFITRARRQLVVRLTFTTLINALATKLLHFMLWKRCKWSSFMIWCLQVK